MSEHQNIDQWCEFSTEIACKYGIELAIIHGFFKKCYYYSSLQDEQPSYPTVTASCLFLPFLSEEKIRELIAQLYIHKLI